MKSQKKPRATNHLIVFFLRVVKLLKKKSNILCTTAQSENNK